ncbi:hypothetical protein HMPREF1400_00765 [Helicobacter pylori GAM119Bi]|nr:hypothetical protein HMPREF1403_01436 [Helicobacter pylori GAM201Ai]EMG94177.1 hypothetical protein HMPREF1400_00765 [Helicobacter pylori GAM119Bi]
MLKGILVFLIPIVLIGLVLTAIRATIMAFRGDTDGFLVEYGINSLNISAIL